MDRLERLRWMTARQFHILEAARQFSAIWDLRYPTIRDLEERHLEAVESFWWRAPLSTACYVNRLPNKRWRDVQPLNYDTPEADRNDCMSAICGTLHARGFLRQDVMDVLRIGGDVHSRHLNMWRRESMDYRWMVCSMRGDLAHKALRNLVLGYPRAC